MENVTQQVAAPSPAPTQPPAAPLPASNQEMPSKNSHILGIILLSVAMLFVVCAIVWFIFGDSFKSKPARIAVSPTPSATATPVNSLPPPTAAEFASLSAALRSGNSFQFAGFSGLDPKTITEQTLAMFAQTKAIVFNEKSFRVTPDGKKASVQVTITLESGKEYHDTFYFTAINGKWIIDARNIKIDN